MNQCSFISSPEKCLWPHQKLSIHVCGCSVHRIPRPVRHNHLWNVLPRRQGCGETGQERGQAHWRPDRLHSNRWQGPDQQIFQRDEKSKCSLSFHLIGFSRVWVSIAWWTHLHACMHLCTQKQTHKHTSPPPPPRPQHTHTLTHTHACTLLFIFASMRAFTWQTDTQKTLFTGEVFECHS